MGLKAGPSLSSSGASLQEVSLSDEEELSLYRDFFVFALALARKPCFLLLFTGTAVGAVFEEKLSIGHTFLQNDSYIAARRREAIEVYYQLQRACRVLLQCLLHVIARCSCFDSGF